MEYKEYRTVDKSSWPVGEWQQEPDKIQWQDEATALPCLIVRNPSGALCGYVGVAKGHPAFGVKYRDVDVSVHGSLTFGDFCQTGEAESEGICHLPSPGEPDHVYWLGFDCAHAFDICPNLTHGLSYAMKDAQYRDVEYVKGECSRLAAQLKAM